MTSDRNALLFLVTRLGSVLFALILAGCSGEPGETYGDLSSRFVDRDGDMVADLPEDPRNWVTPRRLVFAYTPVEDPAVYEEVWSDFLRHLENTTGLPVVFFPVQSNAAQLEAMRAGRLHVTGFNTGSVPLAVNRTGFVPFAMMAAADGTYGYQMEVIVPAESPVTEVSQLRGRTIAFTSPTSNSGYKAPLVFLREQFGLEPDRDFIPRFSGKHDSSILGVANGDYDAASIANSVKTRMVQRGVVDGERLRTIFRSERFPTTAYGHAHNLHPEIAEKVREAFFSYEWKGSPLDKEFEQEDGFIPISYREHWEIIRRIDQAYGISYRE
ncbi:MAG: phosphate/phosphite/phosphonate ABC transporter substrate-binding protein [Puniceicoccaceae bacterium]|nr:MAG: phosphate/phosphite/phosphonate ABC transporter substrate-binding protein [Puniceicoccaceae bacterium]